MSVVEIRRIAGLIDGVITPLYAERFFEERIRKCEFVSRMPCDGLLSGYKDDGPLFKKGFVIRILSSLGPSQRLHALFHELFHVVYLDAGIPLSGMLTMRQRDLFESVIDASAEKFIRKHPEFAASIFEKLFGIPRDERVPA